MSYSWVGALACALATLALLLALAPGQPALIPGVRAILGREQKRRARQLQQARLRVGAREFTIAALVAPILLGGLGLSQSPVLGLVGVVGGALLPGLYVRHLAGMHANRAEAEAPALLSTLVANLGAGTTYYEALRQAHQAVSDRWIREDLAFVLSEFSLDRPLAEAMTEVRGRVRSRNLGLVWDDLAICVANDIPTHRARNLLAELSATLQFNVQLNGEVRSRSAGQRGQILMLALVVPGVYLYLHLVSPELLSVLDETWAGRYLLMPAAACLEVIGVLLSVRLSRVQV